jgi:hypothetical protein
MKHHQNFEGREENSNFDNEKIVFQTDQYFFGVVKGLLVVIKLNLKLFLLTHTHPTNMYLLKLF